MTRPKLRVSGFFVVVLVLLIASVVAAFLTSLLSARASQLPEVKTAHSGAVVIPFGLSRKAETGSMLVNVCGPGSKNELLAEDSDGVCRPSDSKAPPRAADRPAILSTTLINDLVRCDRGRPRSAPNFPADQVQATAELVGVSGIRFLVSANPQNPREVPEGAYCGMVVTERAAGPYKTRYVEVLVSGRGGSAMGMAALMLFYGALAGLLIRFLNDPVAKLVSPYRRYRSVKAWVDSLPGTFPEYERLRRRIAEIEEALWYLDAAAAETKISVLETASEATDMQERATAVNTLPVASGAASAAPTSARRPAPRVMLFSVFRYYWLIGLGAVICFVVASGVWAQYFQNDAFAGSDRDWIGLVIFGLAAQVTTSTVAEALGKLIPAIKSQPGS